MKFFGGLFTQNLAVSMALLGATVSGLAAPIGEATSAKNQVTGELGQVSQRISVGSTISSDETIRTGTASSTDLRFLDTSNLSIGAGSVVLLDRHIFDPNRGSVDSFVDLSKGAMRFISAGRRTNNFVIGTPVATVGIRGTDCTFVQQLDEVGFLCERGMIRVCPHRDGQQITTEFQRACVEGNAVLLPCGFYEVTSEEEQKKNLPKNNRRKNDEDGNFLLLPGNCGPGTMSNLSQAATNAVNAQLAAGGAIPDLYLLSTQAFAPAAAAPLLAGGLSGGASIGVLTGVGIAGISATKGPTIDLPPERCVSPPCPCKNPPCNQPTTPPNRSLIEFNQINDTNGPQSSFRE